MKIGRIVLMLVLLLGLMGINPAIAQSQGDEELDRDTLGKVVVQVVDANTLEPVNEVFLVNFFDSLKLMNLREDPYDTSSLEWYGKTDNKGHVVAKIKPGFYYLQFIPVDCESKYEYEPSPLLSERNRQSITVESHKITQILKKANFGGKLDIILVDPNGKRINPQTDFSPDIKIELTVNSEDYDLGIFPFITMTAKTLTDGKDSLNDGKVVIGRLYPGKYQIQIDFGLLGYKYKEIRDIQVSRNQTTITQVLVDINDGTGIEGYITDQNGNPLKNLYVIIDSTKSRTDQNGYYRIVGIDQGIHKMDISYGTLSTKIFFKYPTVKITKGNILRKDFAFDIQ